MQMLGEGRFALVANKRKFAARLNVPPTTFLAKFRAQLDSHFASIRFTLSSAQVRKDSMKKFSISID